MLLRETADGTHNTTNAYKCYCSGPSSLWVCFATCSDAFDTCLDLSEPYVMSANMKGNASNHANCENPNYLYLEIFNFAEQVDLSSVAPRDGGCHKASYHIVLSSHRLSLDATITCNGSIGGIPPSVYWKDGHPTMTRMKIPGTSYQIMTEPIRVMCLFDGFRGKLQFMNSSQVKVSANATEILLLQIWCGGLINLFQSVAN